MLRSDGQPVEANVTRCPFRVVVDTREQAPFRFSGLRLRDSQGGSTLLVELVTDRCLRSGDYSIDGFENRFAIERKSKPDLYGSLTGDRDRFEREMQRLTEMEFAAVVVESDWSGLRAAPNHTSVGFEAIEGSILSWSVKYSGVRWFLCESRRHAEWVTWKLMNSWWKKESANE